jgi:pullulanase/glycogen debranching enzyme
VNPAGKQDRSAPLGAKVSPDGVNFSLLSRKASSGELVFFDREDDPRPARVISIDPVTNLTCHYWHVFVLDVKPGQIYGYRVHGPMDPAKGLRFDPAKVLLDPYGHGVVVPENYSREAARTERDNGATAMKSIVVDPHSYDWEGDAPLKRPSSRTIVYEMHVRGFTRHPNSGVEEKIRGAYRGLIEKIPHLQQLGITAVELLPVFQFDAQDCPAGLTNYWGYSPVSFFAPHRAYSSNQGPLGPANEFRDMVRALHRAGIEVILNVVFNHAAEGDQNGATVRFRGIDNSAYYVLDQDRSRYADHTGTGNTLNANHSTVRRLILDSLRYWVQDMHVAGFRFDVASILARDSSGQVMSNPPILWDIESEPALAGTRSLPKHGTRRACIRWAASLETVGKSATESFATTSGASSNPKRVSSSLISTRIRTDGTGNACHYASTSQHTATKMDSGLAETLWSGTSRSIISSRHARCATMTVISSSSSLPVTRQNSSSPLTSRRKQVKPRCDLLFILSRPQIRHPHSQMRLCRGLCSITSCHGCRSLTTRRLRTS